jgi:fucose permease
MNFPCVYVIETYGLRWGVIAGIVSTAVGLWIRCLINVNFYTVLVGQIIIAMGQPLLYNAPGKVTTNWFP